MAILQFVALWALHLQRTSCLGVSPFSPFRRDANNANNGIARGKIIDCPTSERKSSFISLRSNQIAPHKYNPSRRFLRSGDEKDENDVRQCLPCLHPLSDLRHDNYAALLDLIPPSVQIVLIGEGTHGTQEFFQIRSEVTKALLQQQRGQCGRCSQCGPCGQWGQSTWDAILCEGDVQPFFQLNQLISTCPMEIKWNINESEQRIDRGDETIGNIRSMLSELFRDRFPDWMWSNVPMAEFVYWLKCFNQRKGIAASKATSAAEPSCGMRSIPVQLYGMDIQSPFTSMDYIIQQLTLMGESELVDLAQSSYRCLTEFLPNIRQYGDAIYGNKVPSQELPVRNVLDALLERYVLKCDTQFTLGSRDSALREQQIWFELIQNAHAVVDSEKYHRQRVFPGHVAAWNTRTHAFFNSMLRTIEHIRQMKRVSAPGHVKGQKEAPVRIIVWGHNSHVGDMRSNGYSSLGQISLGQLCREAFGNDGVFLIGTTTYEGNVRAAHADMKGSCWKGKGEVMSLRKAMDDSHEHVLHSIAEELGLQSFGTSLQSVDLYGYRSTTLTGHRSFRFVGSCYLPQMEKMSHYTQCDLKNQFDYVIHVDNSSELIT